MLTPNEVKAIRERADRATPGPWSVAGKGEIVEIPDKGDGVLHWGNWGMGYEDVENAEFIAHARQDVPALCETCEELRGLLD